MRQSKILGIISRLDYEAENFMEPEPQPYQKPSSDNFFAALIRIFKKYSK